MREVPSPLELLRELVELESPTGHTAELGERLADELAALGGSPVAEGEHLRAEFSGEGRPLLLLGHLDTVWPRGTLATMPWRVEDGRAYGPGSYDMKGGLVVMLEGIRVAQTDRAVRVVLTADEEIGSPSARDTLARAAAGAAAAFVCEPPTSRGNLKTARKGIGRFELRVTGHAAHSASPRHGVSAIEELARLTLRLHALNDRASGVTVNVGVVSGGTRANVVAAEATARIDVRVPTLAERERVERILRSLDPETEGASIEVGGGWTRPPLERSTGAAVLFERAREHGRALGLDLGEASVAGGSDGNLVGALGVPVLDGLGAEGGGAHAVREHVLVPSLEVRAQLLARILRDPGV
ncbi:MAG: M20 family metallopeptidase [Gaiellaceae bacterium]